MKALETKKPDIILLDIQMPIMDGVQATQLIKSQYPEIGIIVLTMHNEEEFIIHLVEKGANAFLAKDADFEEIIDAIYSVNESGYYFSSVISGTLAKGLMNKQIENRFKVSLNPHDLSERELEIIKLICQELTNKEIANKIGISHRTVDGYRERIIKRLNVKNTAGIVLYAAKNNLI